MLHSYHRKPFITKRVSFSTKHSVHFYLDSSQGSSSNDSVCKQKDPLPKERRMEQLISRRAVLSFQRHLRSKICCNDKSSAARLAEVSNKFSKRAREVAQETARLNYLEVHIDSNEGKRPRYSPEPSLKANVPVPVSEFPVVKLTRRPPLTRRSSSGDLYQRR